MKRKPIASDYPLLISKLTQDQVCKCTIQKVKRFVRKLHFSWPKNFFLSFVVWDLSTFKYVESIQSFFGPLIAKFCLVRIALRLRLELGLWLRLR